MNCLGRQRAAFRLLGVADTVAEGHLVVRDATIRLLLSATRKT